LLTSLTAGAVEWTDAAAAWQADWAGESRVSGNAPADESDGRSGRAASAPKKHAPAKGSTRKKFDYGFTAEREAAALTFVRQYHPELASLLTVLKTKEKEEYHRAVRDLFRASERLALYREKFPERYDLELKAWQVKSRIQLLATRLKLTPEDTNLAHQLKSALIEQNQIRVEMLRQDREHQALRLKRLDEQIEKLQEHRELNAQRQLEALLRSVKKKPPPPQVPREAGRDGPKREQKQTKQPPTRTSPTQ
jgi:hypothetical protein